MRRVVRSRWFFTLNVVLVVVLVTYQLYLNFFEQDFTAVHAEQVERIEAVLAERERYRFAVVGNINNSVGIFERKIIPMLNRSGVDFVISAGNAVNSGGEDKYRALHRTLGNLQIPYLLTFGENEHSRLGSFRFYDHYGPYLFSFAAGGTRFISSTAQARPIISGSRAGWKRVGRPGGSTSVRVQRPSTQRGETGGAAQAGR